MKMCIGPAIGKWHMIKSYKYLVVVFSLFMSLQVFAYSCSTNADCNAWESQNCACGISAICQGVTASSHGNCQCYGAQGSCAQKSSEEANSASGYPRARAKARRRGTARRGAVRNNTDGQVESIEISR